MSNRQLSKRLNVSSWMLAIVLAGLPRAYGQEVVRGRPVGVLSERLTAGESKILSRMTPRYGKEEFALFVQDGQEYHVPLNRVAPPKQHPETDLFLLRKPDQVFRHQKFTPRAAIKKDGTLFDQDKEPYWMRDWIVHPDGGVEHKTIGKTLFERGDILKFIGNAGTPRVQSRTPSDTMREPYLGYSFDADMPQLVQHTVIERTREEPNDFQTGVPVGLFFVDGRGRGYSHSNWSGFKLEQWFHVLEILADGSVVYRIGESAFPVGIRVFSYKGRLGIRYKYQNYKTGKLEYDGPFIAAPGIVQAIITYDGQYDFDPKLRVFKHAQRSVLPVDLPDRFDQAETAALSRYTQEREAYRLIDTAPFRRFDPAHHKFVETILGMSQADEYQTKTRHTGPESIRSIAPICKWENLSRSDQLQVYKSLSAASLSMRQKLANTAGLVTFTAVVAAALHLDPEKVQASSLALAQNAKKGYPIKFQIRKSGQTFAGDSIDVSYRERFPGLEWKTIKLNVTNGVAETSVPTKMRIRVAANGREFDRRYRQTITVDVESSKSYEP